MNKYILGGVVILILIASVYVTAGKKDDSVIIGAILSLSGTTQSFYGEYNKRAIDLFVSQVPEVQGKKLKVLYEDSEGDKTKAINAYNKLRAEGVSYFITGISPVSVAIAPLAQEDKVVLIATSASNPNISTAGDYVFRTKMAAQHEGVSAAEYIAGTLKPKSVAFLYQNSDYGTGVFNTFSKKVSEAGIKIVAEEKFSQGSVNMRTELAKIHAARPDLVVVAAFPKEVGQVLKQSGEMGYGLKFFAHSGSIGPDIEKVAGPYAQGLVFATELTKNTPEYAAFREIYAKQYTEEPELLSANAHDAMSLLVHGLKSCDLLQVALPACVKNTISTIARYRGVAGNITFDQNGDITERGLQCMTKQYKDGLLTDPPCIQ